MEMKSDHRHDGQAWKCCALCRSLNQSKAVLYRSLQRKVDWPKSSDDNKLTQEPAEYTSVDEAFSTIMQCMMTTSRQCQKYMKTCTQKSLSHKDCQHISRFHSSSTQMQHNRRNPVVDTEHVNVQIRPGQYVVTAHERNTGQIQTHIINVEHGQSVNLDFTV